MYYIYILIHNNGLIFFNMRTNKYCICMKTTVFQKRLNYKCKSVYLDKNILFIFK